MSRNRTRTLSRAPVETEVDKTSKKLKRIFDKKLFFEGKGGITDHKIYDWKPKHLNSGKRGIGSTDYR